MQANTQIRSGHGKSCRRLAAEIFEFLDFQALELLFFGYGQASGVDGFRPKLPIPADRLLKEVF
jgi:hypothetical protein